MLTSSQQVYVRSRPPDFSWTQDDDDVVEDKPYQGALQAASQLAGLTPSGSTSNLGLSHSIISASFIEPFPGDTRKISIKDHTSNNKVP
jgi:hypothetical protein